MKHVGRFSSNEKKDAAFGPRERQTHSESWLRRALECWDVGLDEENIGRGIEHIYTSGPDGSVIIVLAVPWFKDGAKA